MAHGEASRDHRPDPDALLAAAGDESRGRLKIFLGAAPGVGKTYAMLSAARQLRREGGDVVVGFVETHRRPETEALLDGLDVLARRKVSYHDHLVEELDLDAALARKPALLVVDELAHTNPPDSRHPKRYQDVEELLRAGIDVWTAVNIQHLESLSDVVSRITGVVVRETVPDTVLEKANEVVVVDLTPAELIARLREGKIYLPDTARRAANNFFKPGNLTALRELALRRTADRVDDQMVAYLRQNAIEGAWPTAERLLVCVGPDALSTTVVKAASRLASGLNASWIAVTLERTGGEITDEATLRRLDETMRLAERLGADTARLVARDLPSEILGYARRENITQIVVGRSGAGPWARLRGRSLSDALVRRAADIAIHVVVGEAAAPPRLERRRPERRKTALGLVTAAGTVAAAVLIGSIASRYLLLPNLSMIFLAAVLICAVSLGVGSAIAAAILSFLAYNFFFIRPIYTFTIAEPHEFLALVIFLLVAVLTGGLAGRVRDQSNAARKRVATIQALYDVSRKLSGTASLEDVLWIVARQAAAAIRGQVLILLPGADDLEISAAFPPEDTIGPSERAAANWAFRNGEVSGWRSGTLPSALYRFLPLRTSRGMLGVVGFEPPDRDVPLAADDERSLAALLDQAAVAIERTLLVAQARVSDAKAERERLLTALLSSISHDLRTPLASIIGAVTSVRKYGSEMPDADRSDLLAAIEEEASRLARFVANLLDMTKLEAGALDLRRDWIDVADAVRAAVDRAGKAFPDRRIDLEIAPDLPLVRGDAVLLEQVVFNLLDNADKYVPAGTLTVVRLTAPNDLVIAVEDGGPGIPAEALERVFEKFTRLGKADGRAAGTGLGLAIAKGVVEAMGGTIGAESPARKTRGTRIVVRIPVEDQDRIVLDGE